MALYNMNLVQRKQKRLLPAMGNSRFSVILIDTLPLSRQNTRLLQVTQYTMLWGGSREK